MPEVRVLHLAREIRATTRPTSGAERRLAAIGDQLVRSGIPVLAFARSDDRGGAAGRRAATTWRALPLRVRGARRDIAQLARALFFLGRSLNAIRRFRPTVVYERASYLDPSGLLIARVLRVPYVVELHGDLAADARGYYRSVLEPIGRAFEARRYSSAARVVVVSGGLADLVHSFGVPYERIRVVPNGVSGDVRSSPAEVARLRERWGVGGRHVVGWIGHLMHWQLAAFDQLVDSLAEVDRRMQLALVIVAPEVHTDALRQLRARASFPVVLAGEAVGRAADAAVAAFDVGIVPAARSYDLPVKIFHYGALGVPVVAPATRSISDLDAGRDLLYLFEPGGMAAAVEEALDDPSRAERFREVVMVSHTWPVVADEVFKVCAAAAEERGRTTR